MIYFWLHQGSCLGWAEAALHCSVRASGAPSAPWGAQALCMLNPVIAAHGLSSGGSWALEHAGSNNCSMGLVALQHVWYSWSRDRTRVPCISRQILIHCAIREVLCIASFNISYKVVLFVMNFIFGGVYLWRVILLMKNSSSMFFFFFQNLKYFILLSSCLHSLRISNWYSCP